MGLGMRGEGGNPAAPPFTNGPYEFSEAITFAQGVSGANLPGNKYYVDRNVAQAGNGKTWSSAFDNIADGISALNTDYTAGRQIGVLYIGEGWYAEVPQVLTASDCYIIGVAPGSHDSIAWYGVPVQGTFSGVAGGPALQITASNVTIANIGFYTSDPLYASVQDGGHASDAHLSARSDTFNNRFVNCNFIRDVNNGSLGGLDTASNEGPIIENCTFSTSCKDFGIRVRSNGSTNPVNVEVKNCRFTGTPIGVDSNAGHNIVVHDCWFIDDTTDRPGTVTSAFDATGTTSAVCFKCYGEFAEDSFIVGGTTSLEADNHDLD